MIRRLLVTAVLGLAVAFSGTRLAVQDAPQTHDAVPPRAFLIGDS
jgi:hypothetical protein